MNFLPEELDNYIHLHCEEEPKLLKELNHETWEKVINPRMLSGHVQGRVLSMLSLMIKPLNILEIGTYTGYSAICLAENSIKTKKSRKQNDFFRYRTQIKFNITGQAVFRLSTQNNFS